MKLPGGSSGEAQASQKKAIPKSMEQSKSVPPPVSEAQQQQFAQGPLPLLRFAADWSVTQSEPLVAGEKVMVYYERARLAGHEHLNQGEEHKWVLSAFCSLNGSSPQTFQLGGRSSDVNAEQVLELSEAGTLELWFERSDLYGAHHYDSNYGQNFRFTVLADNKGGANVARQVPLQVPVPAGAS